MERYGYEDIDAGRIASLLPLVSLILSPIFGVIVDKIRKYVSLVIIGLVLLCMAFVQMAFSTATPIIGVVLIGISYSLIPAAVFPYFPFIVDEQYMGTAYGLMTSIMNTGMVIIYYAQGWVMDYFDNTFYLLLFYLGLSIITLIVSLIWFFLDIAFFPTGYKMLSTPITAISPTDAETQQDTRKSAAVSWPYLPSYQEALARADSGSASLRHIKTHETASNYIFVPPAMQSWRSFNFKQDDEKSLNK